MPSDTTYVSIAGIVTAGVLGPAASSWWARRQQTAEFGQGKAVRRKEDLRQLVDEAAVVLARAVTKVRAVGETGSKGEVAGH